MLGRIAFTAAMMLGLVATANAQDADPAAGKTYAEQVCAQCHAVQAGEDLSSAAGATPFQEVANTPGMTEYALSVWLQSSHPTMPNIVLEQDELRNVVAYIRSLDNRQ